MKRLSENHSRRAPRAVNRAYAAQTCPTVVFQAGEPKPPERAFAPQHEMLFALPLRQAVPLHLHQQFTAHGKAIIVDVVENTNEISLAVLASLALDELTPCQLARVEERLQLVTQSDASAAAWLGARLSELARAA